MNLNILLAVLLMVLSSNSSFAMKNKKRADFSNQNISDVSEIVVNDGVLSLNLSNNQITSLEGNNIPDSVISLIINDNNLSSLAGLPANLRSIFARNNNIVNFDNELPETMEILFADNNQIVSINGLANTPNINNLSLDNNQITDISAIQNMQSLTDVSFDDNNVANISFLWPKSVESVSFSNNAIEDISPLAEITALRTIAAIGGEVNLIPDLSKLLNLKLLILNSNQITEFNCDFIPSNIKDISLPNNAISAIPGPCDMTVPKLRELQISSNGLTEINMTLRRARKLRTIDLSSNDLTSLENLTIKPRRASFKLDVRDNGNLPQSEIKAFKRRHPNARVKSGGFF